MGGQRLSARNFAAHDPLAPVSRAHPMVRVVVGILCLYFAVNGTNRGSFFHWGIFQVCREVLNALTDDETVTILPSPLRARALKKTKPPMPGGPCVTIRV